MHQLATSACPQWLAESFRELLHPDSSSALQYSMIRRSLCVTDSSSSGSSTQIANAAHMYNMQARLHNGLGVFCAFSGARTDSLE